MFVGLILVNSVGCLGLVLYCAFVAGFCGCNLLVELIVVIYFGLNGLLRGYSL